MLSVLNDDLVSKGRKVISHYLLNCSFNNSTRYCRVSQVVALFLTLTVCIKLGKLLAPSLLKGRIIFSPTLVVHACCDGGREGQRSTADAKVCSWRRNANIIMGGSCGAKEGIGGSAIIRKAALATFRADYPRSPKGVEATGEFMDDGCEYRGEGR